MTYQHYNEAKGKELMFGTAVQRFIYLECCYEADRKGVLRFTQKELADMMLVSTPAIAKHFSGLREIGLMERLGQGRYKVVVPGFSSSNKQAQAGREETSALEQELRQWFNRNFGKETVGFILQDREVVISESQEDETTIRQSIAAGLMVEERKEDTGDDEPGTLYKLNL